MSFNLKNPIDTLEAYEKWLKILVALTAIFGVITAVYIYKVFTGTGDPALAILLAFSTAIFFFAYREKKAAPRPGSPEYEAIERQHQAQVNAGRERRYRKSHPHQVARELVENNKVYERESYNEEKKKK